MVSSIQWEYIKGGISNFGDNKISVKVKDLLWANTVLTYDNIYSSYSKSDFRMPITMINYNEAFELAKSLNARLPTSAEWEWMASGPEMRIYPWGNTPWDIEKANLHLSNIGKCKQVGSYPNGATPDGILDVAGNVYEFTSSIFSKDGVIIRGGSFNSNILHAKTKFWNAIPNTIRSKGIGIRVVKEIN